MSSRISIKLILLLFLVTAICLCTAQFKDDEPDEETDGQTEGSETDDVTKRAASEATKIKLLPNVHLIFKGQRLDVTSNLHNESKKLPGIEDFLHGETLDQRMRVWSIMANVEAMIDKATTGKTRQIDYDVVKGDLYEGDIVLTEEDAKKIEKETAQQIKDGTLLKGYVVPRPPRAYEEDGSASVIFNPVDDEEQESQPIGSAISTDEGDELDFPSDDPVTDQNSPNLDEDISNLNPDESKRLLEELEQLSEEFSQHDRQKKDLVKRKMSTSTKWSMPIKYSIDKSFTSSEKIVIRSAIYYWQSQTCIRFQESSSTSPPRIRFIKSTNKNICGSSPVGRKGSNTIALRCVDRGTIVHEIGHSLGFWHEQSRPDRDTYVSILLGNIGDKNSEHNFNKQSWKDVYSHGVPYDYYSVMHYRATAFAKPGTKTIRPTDIKLEPIIGQTAGLSFWDSKLVNIHYSCSRHCTTKLRCIHEGYIDPKNCARCRCPDGWTGTTCASLRTQAVCGPSILYGSSSTRYVSTQNYPNPYRPYQSCAWLIRCRSGIVRVWFTGTFSLRYSRRCTGDHVELRYRDLAMTGPRYCGSSRPSGTFLSHSYMMMVIFRGYARGYRGFKMAYRCESCSHCTSTSTLVRACVRSYMTSCPGRYTVRCGFLWLRRCPRYRTNRCLKTIRTCCSGYRLLSTTSTYCVFNGCGGCQNKFVRSQKPCCRKVSYRERYTVKCGFWKLRRCVRYRTRYRDVCNVCCTGYKLVSGRCRK